ncbi:VWA domain-containing protein [candidate division KSB1 bacterium]|nr:VWA domain-containing protein [candidate division KSB1 bacterium]
MAKEITLDFELNKTNLPVSDQTQIAYLLIDAKSSTARFSGEARLNLSLVMDRSASMKGEKIENVKKAMENIIDRLDADDYLSIVTFNEEADVLIPTQPVSDKAALKEKVNELTYSGGTAISSGMSEGLNELRNSLTEDRINRMIVLTDGQTYGDEDQCFELAEEAEDDGIVITALGVGDEWHEDVLDTIAARNDGKSDYIETPDDIIPIFDEEMQSFKNIVTENNKLTLRLANGVTPKKICRVIPYISELEYESFSENEVRVDIGELDQTQGLSVLAELKITPRQQGRFRIAQAELTYDVPAENIYGEKTRADIITHFSANGAESKKINPRVMNTVEKVSAYDLQTRALTQAVSGDISGATQKLRAAATRLLDMGEDDLANAAMEEAENLEKMGSMSSSGTKKLRYETRKLTRRLVA